MFAEDIGLLPPRASSREVLDARARSPSACARCSKTCSADGQRAASSAPTRSAASTAACSPTPSVLDLPAERDRHRSMPPQNRTGATSSPSIFGTLFERGLDPAKRSQIGAHYTSREDIQTLLEPVVMAPLRREWDETARWSSTALATRQEAARKGSEKPPAGKALRQGASRGRLARAATSSTAWRTSRCSTRPAAPATSSTSPSSSSWTWKRKSSPSPPQHGVPSFIPRVGPPQLHGIEINPYAYELAQMRHLDRLPAVDAPATASTSPDDPVLEAHRHDPVHGRDPRPDRPGASRRSRNGRRRISSSATRRFWAASCCGRISATNTSTSSSQLYDGPRAPGATCAATGSRRRAGRSSDKKCKRAGLLATQGIRGGANREVLERIKETGDIFFAVSDRDWILDGATSTSPWSGLTMEREATRTLDAANVPQHQRQPDCRLRTRHSCEAYPEQCRLCISGSR